MVEEIRKDDELLAIILRADFSEPGIHFLTPDHFSQQMAFMKHPAGKRIEAHTHKSLPRQVVDMQEVLFIKRGQLRVDFYDKNQEYVESRILRDSDTMLLIAGGHGFEVLEEVEMIEVKQGPYQGDDKSKLMSVQPEFLRIID